MNKTAVSQPAKSVQSTRWRRRALVAAALLLLIALIWWLLAPQPVNVEVAQASRGPLAVMVSSQGMVRVHDRYVIAAPVAARLQRITLRVGDAVQRGDPVAWLAPVPVDARTRRQLHAELDAARARAMAASLASQQAASNLLLATREHERVARLVRQQFLAQQAADRAETAERNARDETKAARARHMAAVAEVSAATAAVEAVDAVDAASTMGATNKQSLTLYAPVAGQVLAVQQQSERTLAAGTALITLGDPSRYEVVVDVLSTDAVNIRAGMPMLLDEWGGKTPLRATVRLVEPAAFTKISALGVEEQRVNIIADPVSSLHTLGEGYRVLGRIILWQQEAVLKVPASSVFRSGESWQVFTVQNGRAHQRTVQIGQRNEDEVEIRSGLQTGAAIVRFPGNQLSDGARVKVLQAQPMTQDAD